MSSGADPTGDRVTNQHVGMQPISYNATRASRGDGMREPAATPRRHCHWMESAEYGIRGLRGDRMQH